LRAAWAVRAVQAGAGQGAAGLGVAGFGLARVPKAHNTKGSKMPTFKFELTGRTPLLMHADDVEAADTLETWRKDPENKKQRKAGDDRSPAWTWMTYLYADGEQVVMPSDNIMTALRHAGAQITMSGQKTFKSVSQSGLLILEDHCELYTPKGQVSLAALKKLESKPFADQAKAVQALGFSLFVKRATVGQAKHVRVRPRFDDWRVSGTVDVIDPAIGEEVLRQMFDLAGRYAGLGDWRPSSPKKPGHFGTFESKLKRA
jgi:hypothetical protein